MTSALKRVLRLAQKELREILRDRRTIITLLAMPVLLYPLMSIAFLQFYQSIQVTSAVSDFRVGYLTNAEVTAFDRRFKEGQAAILRSRAKEGEKPKDARQRQGKLPGLVWWQADPLPKTEAERAAGLEYLKDLLREGKIDLIITIPELANVEIVPDPPVKNLLLRCQVYVMPNAPIGGTALAYVETVFAAVNEENLKTRLNSDDAAPRIHLVSLNRIVIEAPPAEEIVSLAALVPLILILMTITGAVYPAIDLTAGERERGTLEILVAAPVSRFELLSAKYISVLAVAILTALVNLTCMTVTVAWSGLGPLLFGSEGLNVLLLANILGLLLLFAAFFSAVLLCLTSFARSFKEAQAYLIPLMMASLAPGIIAMLPGLELNRTLAALPLVNIVLLARDLFKSGTDPGLAMIVVCTTLLYALAALSLAARIFGDESVLYSEQSNWAGLVRRPSEPQPAATIPAVLWCLALMVPMHFALAALARAVGPTPAQGVLLVVLIYIIMFWLMPWVVMYQGRVDWRTGMGAAARDRQRLLIGLLAGLILGVSLWPIQLWLLSKGGHARSLIERSGEVLESFMQAKEALGWGVLVTVIVPAILEEFFFRGVLYSALERRSGVVVTILVTAGLFAITHVVLGGAVGMARFLPSLALGLILSTVRWSAGNLWPNVVLHVCHNTILMSIGINDPGSTPEITTLWLIAGMVGTGIGAAIVTYLGTEYSSSRNSNPEAPPQP